MIAPSINLKKTQSITYNTMQDLFEKIYKNKGPLGKWASIAEGYFAFPKLEGPISNRMKFNNQEVITWSVNDYLGLANHPEVRKADADAAKDYGSAYPMGARLMSGHTELHEKLENHNIKIYFYNFPQMTGFTIPVEVIEDLNRQWPERFSGIKDSSGDLDYCRRLSKNENFKVFPSSEVSILEAYKSKFAGCISATANQTLFLSSKAWANKSENIEDIILQIKGFREGISKESLIPSIKYLVSKQDFVFLRSQHSAHHSSWLRLL